MGIILMSEIVKQNFFNLKLSIATSLITTPLNVFF